MYVCVQKRRQQPSDRKSKVQIMPYWEPLWKRRDSIFAKMTKISNNSKNIIKELKHKIRGVYIIVIEIKILYLSI